MKLTLTVEIPDTLLGDLLVGAVEGGSNYWAMFQHYKLTESHDVASVRVVDRDSGKAWSLTPKDMAIGLQQLAEAKFPAAGNHLADVITGNWDATTADVVLQMRCFGDVIYG